MSHASCMSFHACPHAPHGTHLPSQLLELPSPLTPVLTAKNLLGMGWRSSPEPLRASLSYGRSSGLGVQPVSFHPNRLFVLSVPLLVPAEGDKRYWESKCVTVPVALAGMWKSVTERRADKAGP